jgi:hypothetical protein
MNWRQFPAGPYRQSIHYGRFDTNTAFRWSLEAKAPEDPKNKSAREVITIPEKLPLGFNLRIAASTRHTISNGKELVECSYGDAHFFFALRRDATIGLCITQVIGLMERRGLGNQWHVEGNFNEAIEWDHCYEVLPFQPAPEIEVFIKQRKIKVKEAGSWLKSAKKLRVEYGLPRGALFTLFPVDMDIERLGDEDQAYSFDWEAGK